MCSAVVTTNIVGGLGNQLFLVANLLATSKRCGIPAVLERVPCSSSCEAPRPTYWTSLFKNIDQFGVGLPSCHAPQSTIAVPETRPVAPVWLDPRRRCTYNMIGFFQSEGFFMDFPVISDVVPLDLTQCVRQLMKANYGADDAHTVALHVRRGDYLRMTDVFEQLPIEYYDAAVRQLIGGLLCSHVTTSATAALPPIRLLVFCDDDRYGRTVTGFLSAKYPGIEAYLVSERDEKVPLSITEGEAPPREVVELLMMTECNDVVMANSSFSWWGAYLNRKGLRRVVAPLKWFVKDPYPASNHLYCADWLLV